MGKNFGNRIVFSGVGGSHRRMENRIWFLPVSGTGLLSLLVGLAADCSLHGLLFSKSWFRLRDSRIVEQRNPGETFQSRLCHVCLRIYHQHAWFHFLHGFAFPRLASNCRAVLLEIGYFIDCCRHVIFISFHHITFDSLTQRPVDMMWRYKND